MNRMDIDKLQELDEASKTVGNLEQFFTSLKERYSIDINLDFKKINKNLLARKRTSNSQDSSSSCANFQKYQLKLFQWVVFVYSKTKELDLEDLKEHHFQEIQSFFPGRSVVFIQYRILDIFQKNTNKWTQDQDQLLISCINGRKNPEWGEVSFEIFANSNGTCFKSFTQCRERWDNHLNPKIKRNKWTLEEEIELMQEALSNEQTYGELNQTRTTTQRKNHLNSLIRLYKKKFHQKDMKKAIKRGLKEKKRTLDKKSKKIAPKPAPTPKTKPEEIENPAENEPLRQVSNPSPSDFLDRFSEENDYFMVFILNRERDLQQNGPEVQLNRSMEQLDEEYHYYGGEDSPALWTGFSHLSESVYQNHIFRESMSIESLYIHQVDYHLDNF